jgi:hypothetical protein
VLKELCLACEIIIVKEKSDISSSVPSDAKLPFLIDDNILIQGYINIFDCRSELEEFKSQWYKFQSDACYSSNAGNKEIIA